MYHYNNDIPCAGLDTSKDMVIPIDSFLDFLSQYQDETMDFDDAKKLIDRHEPHPDLKRRHLLRFLRRLFIYLDGDR